MKAVGICGTDLKIRAGKIKVKLPLIPGHEIAGVVEMLGPGVSTLSRGDEVIVSFYVPCGNCVFCQIGRETLCDKLVGRLGFEIDGGLAEFIVVPENRLIKKPANIPFHHAAIIPDAIATPYHALVRRGKLRQGESVVIVGGGGRLGIHAVQISKIIGAFVIGIDRGKDKCKLMKKFRVDMVIDVSSTYDWSAEVIRTTNGKGVDLVLDCVGSEETVQNSIACLKNGGRLVLVGYEQEVSINSQALVLKEIEIYGSRAATKVDIEECVKLVAEGQIEPVVGVILPCDKVNDANSLVQQGSPMGRVVIMFGEQ